jgi:hypothetical protein
MQYLYRIYLSNYAKCFMCACVVSYSLGHLKFWLWPIFKHLKYMSNISYPKTIKVVLKKLKNDTLFFSICWSCSKLWYLTREVVAKTKEPLNFSLFFLGLLQYPEINMSRPFCAIQGFVRSGTLGTAHGVRLKISAKASGVPPLEGHNSNSSYCTGIICPG